MQRLLVLVVLAACQPTVEPSEPPLDDAATDGADAGEPLHRAPCAPGRFDLDGVGECEATCEGTVCHTDGGQTIHFTSPPLHETGLVLSAPTSGAGRLGATSFGSFEPASASALPASATHVLQPGFAAATTRNSP